MLGVCFNGLWSKKIHQPYSVKSTPLLLIVCHRQYRNTEALRLKQQKLRRISLDETLFLNKGTKM